MQEVTAWMSGITQDPDQAVKTMAAFCMTLMQSIFQTEQATSQGFFATPTSTTTGLLGGLGLGTSSSVKMPF